ncbi:AT hook domain-containing protein [Colletotrichum higginsianum IMI 349063]|uniref:AT hook domain-containing protein n=2 Tax=Colletotrichum higginsianum (strain IMI 349063) TaxID=759273 RepID=A0A1B7Y2E5_COLHI|nr:AT hook domain-containing protein [Colletotrichum higginsianum IMI 349063]OBR06193.1 AT hook domain-containing protein [Colletotrichum higginsianum IMI 349063]
MAPPRVIADSDDSDDGFDLGDDSPMKPPTPKIPSGDRSSDSASVATGSTDPKFFQAIYAEQQRAAVDEALSNHVRSSTSDNPSSLAAPAKPQAKKDSTTTTTTTSSSSLPTIPDPVMGSHRAKKAEKTRVVVDLTQVITPGRSNNATPRDMWDVPSSPASDQAAPVFPISSKARTPCSNKKRKRGDKMEATSPLATGIPSQGSTQPFDATPATRTNAVSVHEAKRWRLGNPESSLPAEDDVDMVVPLDVADVPSFRDLVSGQKPISLCIEPPQTLSASQRQEYKYHSVDPSQEDQAPVPTQPFSALPATARSSGATTIAYSTPSQTRVVGRPLTTFADHTTLDTVPERTQETSKVALDPEATVEILSSPDIISAAPARRKRGRDDDKAYKKVETHQANASWDSDGTGFHCKTFRPRTSRKVAGDGCWQDQTEHREETNVPAPDMGAAAQTPTGESALASLPKAKRRGRPRKSEVAAVASTVAIEAPAPPQATESDDVAKESAGVEAGAAGAATPQTKKKRGRPRKADKSAMASGRQGADEQSPAEVEGSHTSKHMDVEMDETPTKGIQAREPVKRGRGKKGDQKPGLTTTGVAGTSPTTDGSQVRGEDLVLQPVTPNVDSKSGSGGPDPQSAATEQKAAANCALVGKGESKTEEVLGKADGKKSSMAPASSAGKPIYRVGLSKKSRIAPLLKSLRK